MSKVGLLTMHRVVNFGSVLQAYATQVAIEKLGYDCTIIDYKYPNDFHEKPKGVSYRVYDFAKSILQGFPRQKQIRGINNFIDKNLKLSEVSYCDRESLKKNAPKFDKYVVGSDQTWNTTYTKGDDIFLLNFVDSSEKIAYASCAAHTSVESCFESLFKDNLNKFKSISVRDSNTKSFVKNILGLDVPIVLDPTLLLDQSDWNVVAQQSNLHELIKGKYILVYILSYSFNPYPFVTDVIRQIYKEIGLPVVIIRYAMRKRLGVQIEKNFYEGISPEDFVWLFSNASFVVTTSFHGTAFAINYDKPFYAIYNSKLQDNRIKSLLQLLGCEQFGISVNSDIPQYFANYTNNEILRSKLTLERTQSIEFLKIALSN